MTFLDVDKIREDFPVLQRKINGKPILYLDSACITLKPHQVIKVMQDYYYNFPACTDRSSHKLSMEVSEACEEARIKIQKFFNAKRCEEIIFTRNATEAINLVAQGLDLKEGDVVITTDKEHNSNLIPWLRLKKERGIIHKVVKSNPDNTFNLESFGKLINPRVKLVSMVHTSNIDGYTLPAKKIVDIAHRNGSLVLLDGAQSAPQMPIDVQELDVDFFACSIHKMLGPTGVGILYGKYELLQKLHPLNIGGDTVSDSTYLSFSLLPPPAKFEAGLQDYAGIIGAGAAIDYLNRVGMKNIKAHETRLNKIITEGIKDFPGIRIIGPSDPALRGGIVNFTVDYLGAQDIAMILDETANIMVRAGRHCVHSWYNSRKIKESVRASVYIYNTSWEAEFFVHHLLTILKKFI